jgi:hypothetical protein
MIRKEVLDVTTLGDREVVEDDMDLTLAAHAREKALRKATKAAELCCSTGAPMTLPVRVFSAA